MDILRVYRLLRRMSQYPNLTGLMRSIFMDVLEQRGIVSRDRIAAQVLEEMQKDGVPVTEANRQEYLEALTDTYVAHSLTSSDIENYINLARKKDNAQTLSMLVNRDQATSKDILAALREFCDIPKGEVYISREEAEGIRVALISRFISNQLPFISLAKNYITIRDTDAILQNTLFSRQRPGKLGGKAAGMILAHKILLPTLEKKDPDLEGILRVPDTWYLNSGVFSEFLDRNNLYLFHTFKYKDRESIEKEFLRIEEQFKSATFAPEVVEDFRGILEQIGEHPIIIRSSSMLEDNFGLAFSGKYQSVFLGNLGPHGHPAEPVHRRPEKGVFQHLRPGPHPLPAGPRPPRLRRADGHDRSEGCRPPVRPLLLPVRSGRHVLAKRLCLASENPARGRPGPAGARTRHPRRGSGGLGLPTHDPPEPSAAPPRGDRGPSPEVLPEAGGCPESAYGEPRDRRLPGPLRLR